jgi:hypothetical protein
MAEPAIELVHYTLLSNTSILAKKSRCRDQFIKEAVEIKFSPNNMNGKDRFSLIRS